MKGVYWTSRQRLALQTRLEVAGRAFVYRQALALLQIDLGRSVAQVAGELGVARRTVHRWAEKFSREGGSKALERRPGQGRPPQWSQELESLLESALAQPPLELGYPANGWTLPLLQAFLSVQLPELKFSLSTSTLRRHLKRMGYAWKRFRYRLLPDPQEEKKTPDSAPNQGFARANRAAGPG
jgi:transposase